jgi:putative RNA 2'-phosphotransferase
LNEANLTAIFNEGLKPGQRQHVHLSPNIETAKKVGQRHGKPVVLAVDAVGLHMEGHAFYKSENEVWLTDAVPKDRLLICK